MKPNSDVEDEALGFLAMSISESLETISKSTEGLPGAALEGIGRELRKKLLDGPTSPETWAAAVCDC
eukprot:189070-Amorphochlora_amoeboformis.AAC.2